MATAQHAQDHQTLPQQRSSRASLWCLTALAHQGPHWVGIPPHSIPSHPRCPGLGLPHFWDGGWALTCEVLFCCPGKETPSGLCPLGSSWHFYMLTVTTIKSLYVRLIRRVGNTKGLNKKSYCLWKLRSRDFLFKEELVSELFVQATGRNKHGSPGRSERGQDNSSMKILQPSSLFLLLFGPLFILDSTLASLPAL